MIIPLYWNRKSIWGGKTESQLRKYVPTMRNTTRTSNTANTYHAYRPINKREADCLYDKNKRKHAFQNAWRVDCPWLVYNPEKFEGK